MRIFACLASSLDGKIASHHNPKERFGSKTDLEHLFNVRSQAEAILSGGETFRQFSGIRKGPHQTEIPIQCILTRRFDLPVEASLFQKALESNLTIIIFSPTTAPSDVKSKYPSSIEWVTISPERAVADIIQMLQDKGVQSLSIEGGGHLTNLFLEAKALQEFYLTICPLFLGSTADPSLVNGLGFSVPNAPRSQIISAEWHDQELFLHLKLQYS